MAHALDPEPESPRQSRATIPTRVPQSPTPRSIVPSDVPPASPSGRQRSIHRAGSFDEREDHKAALTKQYLDDQARLEEDGYVPPSEVDSETRELPEEASEEERDDEENEIRLVGFVRAGECVEAVSRTRSKKDSIFRWQRVGLNGGVELIENARGERYVCQDIDVGSIIRVVRCTQGVCTSAVTTKPVSAMETRKESTKMKRKEIVLPQLPLGPTSEAHELFLQGKMFEAQSYELQYDEEMSEEKAKEALRCYVLAAKERYIPAYSSIGRIYELGIGVNSDYEQARGWYKEGVKEGCAICHNNLGSLEYLELGIGADRENAAQYFITAAEKGNAAAMNNLAVCYEEGVGVSRNFREATAYYEQAVRGGIMSAFPALGYADIINGDLHHALDAFHASLECGNDKAVEGIAMLSTLPTENSPVAPVESESKNVSIELMKMEIDQYATLSMKLYDLILSSNSASLKKQANKLVAEGFGDSYM